MFEPGLNKLKAVSYLSYSYTDEPFYGLHSYVLAMHDKLRSFFY